MEKWHNPKFAHLPFNPTTDSYIRQYLRTCSLERYPLDNDNVFIVTYSIEQGPS